MTSSGIDPATFRFVALCPNHCVTACPTLRRRSLFTVCIKSKPRRYGLKVWVCELLRQSMFKFASIYLRDWWYTGSQPKKSSGYEHRGTMFWFLEGCYCDKCFTSGTLAEDLFKKTKHNGTMRSNKREMLQVFSSTPKGRSVEALLKKSKVKFWDTLIKWLWFHMSQNKRK
jgi:hypothetical protein